MKHSNPRLQPGVCSSTSAVGAMPLQRTPCNIAVLAALSVLSASGQVLAAPVGTVLAPNTIPVLRGLVSDYKNSATFMTAPMPNATGQSLTINQLLPKIILDWNQFNIGNGSKVEFIQPSATAAVLNRIYDKDPSIIQGQLKANGQVYLINQNGILFDRGTKIDVNTLVASTLNIDNAVFNQGVASGSTFTPAFDGGYDANGRTVAGVKTGSIVVGANGNVSGGVPQLSARTGGAMILIAPVIDNQSGMIMSPDGQVILAAGRTAYLGFPVSNDPAFRGLLVEISAGTDSVNVSSLIRNSGTITADRGNVTLAGLAINQAGRVSASSAMVTNGSVYLQARSLGNERRGTVTLQSGSVTETPLDLSDTTKLRKADNYSAYRPVINIAGAQIVSEGTITSPSGNVSLDASDPSNPAGARIYLAPHSTIDASGAWSDDKDSSNLLTFKVTSNELKDSPDQKAGILKGATVTVDLRTGSPLLDLSGYQENQRESLAQKASTGGSVQLSSTGSVIVRTDATVDVSGGGIRYQGGTSSTTKLLAADGKVYDIGSAPEALRYMGIGDTFVQRYTRWGYNDTFSSLLVGRATTQPDYLQGSAGGSLRVAMGAGLNGVVLDGSLLGGVTVGSRQTTTPPAGASLTVGYVDPSKRVVERGIGDVVFRSGVPSSLPAGFGPTSAVPDYVRNQLTLSSSLFATGNATGNSSYETTGFGTLTVYANGRISVPEGVDLRGPVGGTLRLNANQISLDAKLTAPGGAIALTNIETVGTASSPVSNSSIAVGPKAVISTAGTWTNSFISGAAVATPADPTGGSIVVNGPRVSLMSGSTLDVSAGGNVSARGALTNGGAGSIDITADAFTTTSPLELGATLRGFGFTSGGALNLTVGSQVHVGSDGEGFAGLTIAPSFFSQGGFSKYSLSTLGDLSISGDASIRLSQQNLAFNANPALVSSGADIGRVADVVRLRDDQRRPVSASFDANSAVTMASGSVITADPGASVSFTARTGLLINGVVSAPGGKISASLTAADLLPRTPRLELGAKGSLSVRGAFVATPNDRGLTQGTLYDAGSVSLSARRAELVLQPGSMIDLSGVTQRVDVAPQAGSSMPYSSTTLFGNAGTLGISGNDNIVLAGTLTARAAGTGAGGSFGLTANPRGDRGDPGTGRRIVVTQSGAPVDAAADLKDIAVSADQLSGSGFDKLRLTAENQILFGNDATLRFGRGITLDSQLVQVANDARVDLSAASVKLANSFGLRLLSNPEDLSDPRTGIDNARPSPPQPTAGSGGQLSVMADTIDVFGSVTIGGTASTDLRAEHDLRLSGRAIGSANSAGGAKFIGSLRTAGNLTLTAAQLYPTTASSFSVDVADGLIGRPTAGGRLEIKSSGAAAGAVYSVGGALSLSADTVVQGGVVKAPLGSLNIKAGSTLDLQPGSLTSVASGGLTIPYGETQSGVTWTYAAANSDPISGPLSAPPSKQVKLDAPSINVAPGAKVDLSGGGDVAAIEFVPGSGGSKDALLQANTYAILPASKLTNAPIDPDLAQGAASGFGSDSAIYNTIRVGPGGDVPAGDYALLPGYYGLLPGGYLVQVLTSSSYSNLTFGQTSSLQNGLTVQAGLFTAAGAGAVSSKTVGVVIRPGSDITKLAGYTVTTSSYFADLAERSRKAVPRLPGDGGQLSISATKQLALNGTVIAALNSNKALGAIVDLSAEKIALVDALGRTDVPSDFLQINAGGLSTVGSSLLVGGIRSFDESGQHLTPTASRIVVANDSSTALAGPEVILAATDSITVKSGSVIKGVGGSSAQPSAFTVDGAGSGALLRVANNGLASFVRSSVVDSSKGSLTVESSATLSAIGSLALDGTQGVFSAGSLAVADGGALQLSSNRVSLGEVGGFSLADSGLVLDNARLAGFSRLGALSLKSYKEIDFYGQTQLAASTLGSLTLDAPLIQGRSGAAGESAASSISGQRVTVVNTSGASPGVAAAGTGLLTIDAREITIGSGDKAVSGYATVHLNASSEILAAGSGSLVVAAPLQLTAGRISSLGGADQMWQASDTSGASPVYVPITIDSPSNLPTLTDSGAFGSRLSVIGSKVTASAPIVFKAGSVSLEARGDGTDDAVRLNKGAVIDASGAAKDFAGTMATVNAGTVSLVSKRGSVILGTETVVNLSASPLGGDAGSLSISGHSLEFTGSLRANAGKGQGGSFSLDAAALSDFSALNLALAGGQFSRAIDVRQRSGDLVVGAGDVVTAHNVTLSADQGKVSVAGRIDASSESGGGAIGIYGKEVQLAAGARLEASGTSTDTRASARYSDGGSVKVVAEGGPLQWSAGAVVDVRSGGKGRAGSVLMRAPRVDGGIDATLAGQVLSQRNSADAPAPVVVEANRIYDASSLTASNIAGLASDNFAFMSAVSSAPAGGAITGDGGAPQGNVHVRPAVEVRSSGDLVLASDWDLTGPNWRVKPSAGVSPEAGSLVVRAAGDLTLASASLGNPDSQLVAGSTWNIQLTSGADLSAADPSRNLSNATLATQAASGTAGPGDLVLDSITAEASIRTGTGSIKLSAGRDFTIKAKLDPTGQNFATYAPNPDDPSSVRPLIGVVYTTGEAAIRDSLTSAADARFAKNGGDIAVSAQRDAVGAGNEWMTEWFRTITNSDISDPDAGRLGSGAWWSYRPNFHDGIAALGGGNVTVRAGRDVDGLSAWAPTSARAIKDGGQLVLQTFGGGDLSVLAGNDILGGQYMVSLGEGRLTAVGSIGTPQRRSQMFLMGASSDLGKTGAKVNIDAGEAVYLAAIANPATYYQIGGQPEIPSFTFGDKLNFLSYSVDSAVSVTARSRELSLDNRPDPWRTLNADAQYGIDEGPLIVSPSILPSRVDLVSLGSDVVTPGVGLNYLYPSLSGRLKVLASGNIVGANFWVSDTSPSAVDVSNYPQSRSIDLEGILRNGTGNASQLITSTVQDKFINELVALNGDIQSPVVSFPQRSRIWANRDVTFPSLQRLQNTNDADETQIVAYQGSILNPQASWVIGGPGLLRLQAGEDVDLGTAQLTSIGNQLNGNLKSAEGANIVIIAGLSGDIDLARLAPAFKGLLDAGTTNDVNAAKAAIAKLFAGATVGKGNISSYLTSVQSTAGGDIDLLAPGGDIKVGLTTPGKKQIGLITTSGGNLRSYLSGNFEINQGKLLTAQGGDILIYTTEGGIDAGRGAKTSVTTPPPTRKPIFDAQGNLLGYEYVLPQAVAGSGIQTATSKPGGPSSVAPPPGNVYLFAPAGVIDAGEAGITSAGNIIVAALTVLNADNISFAGTSVGVPQAVIGSIASSVAASGAATASGSSKDADAATQSAAAAAQAAAAGAFKPAILTVEVMGFGEKNCKEQDKNCFAK